MQAGLRGPVGKRLYVEPLYVEKASSWPDADQLIEAIEAHDDPACVLEERGKSLVLLQRDEDGDFQFIRASRAPDRAAIEKLAKEAFDRSDVRLSVVWVVDSPYLFVVGWNSKGHQRALPLVGLGPARWRPLSEQLAAAGAAVRSSRVVAASEPQAQD